MECLNNRCPTYDNGTCCQQPQGCECRIIELNDSPIDHNGMIRNLELEREKLIIALHETINRHLGIVPDSALEFYDPDLAKDAGS